MKVSICVAQFNRADRIAVSIGSLLNQDYENFEVIVVNDGSTDPSLKPELDDLMAKHQSRLTVIHQKNAGFVAAMNQAIQSSRGEYIAIHGAGDISFSKRIKTQATYLDNHPEIGLVSCLFSNVVIGGGNHGNSTIKPKKKGIITAADLLGLENPFGHGEVMYRRELFDKVGGYRPYFKFAQDRDLWLRMIEHSKMIVIQELLYERGVFTKDGVSTVFEKGLVQKHLAALARDCYRTRKYKGYDLVDKYGEHAGLFRKGCKFLAKNHALQAVEHILKDNFSIANMHVEYGLQEKVTFMTLSAWCVNEVVKIKILHRLFKRIVLGIYPNSAKNHRT